MTIIDTASRTDGSLQALRRAGVTGVIRYYCRTTRNPQKRLTRAEAQKIVDAGLTLAVVYQGSGRDAGSFSREAGALDGDHAYRYGTDVIGQPDGSAVYFAVDYDAQPRDIRDHIVPYFRAARAAFREKGGRLRVGVYGSGAVCRAVLDAGHADLAWVSQSRAHAGREAFLATGRWALRQGPTKRIAGLDVDPNDVNPAADGHGEFTRLGGAAAGDETLSFGAPAGASVKALQDLLSAAGYHFGAQDGEFDRLTRTAVLAFQADNGLPVTGTVDRATLDALDKASRRPLASERFSAGPEVLREKGSRIVSGADNVKRAGLVSSLLGALGLGNGAAVTLAGQIAGAGQAAAAPKQGVDGGKLIQAFDRALSPPKGSGNFEIENLLGAIKEIQGAALEKALTPDNLTHLDLLKKALTPSSSLLKRHEVEQFFAQLPASVENVPAAAAPAAKHITTIFDLLPGLFSDGTLHSLAQGLSIVAGGLVPGFGGSLLALGVGLAARHFADRIIAARVDDHRTAANVGL